jgi:hypothetical protein
MELCKADTHMQMLLLSTWPKYSFSVVCWSLRKEIGLWLIENVKKVHISIYVKLHYWVRIAVSLDVLFHLTFKGYQAYVGLPCLA